MGLLTAAIKKTATAPFHRVQLQLQNQSANPCIRNGIVAKYDGMADCVARVYVEEGLLSFWRGALLSCLDFLPATMFDILFKPSIAYTLRKALALVPGIYSNYPGQTNSMFAVLMRVGRDLISYPRDCAEIRISLGMDDGKGTLKVLTDCYTSTFTSPGGLLRWCSCFVVSVASATLYRSAYLSIFRLANGANPWKNDDHLIGLLSRFLAAQVTISLAAAMVYPFETVKNRLRMQVGGSHDERFMYLGPVDWVKKIMREEGVLGFYGGFTVKPFGAMASSIVLVVCDQCIQ
ncbi:unnamed protein product [Polarella glacialis]|uniref:ADP/ATP translocase n=1 Tax=Polarella glacialis TaxID=89957 RepID=A0A813K0N1_POLGL|nr:unnamed protein product [Polarella glacialis]